ncbi:MAG: hypothetical protein SYC29_00985 [Planctomycetota bacterium]|nr:hypothetical protein [Planctomycetota bacterium]
MMSGAALGQWSQIHRLTADDAEDLDFFGSSVSVSGAIAVVGARLDDDACPDNPYCDSGAAYVFDATTGEQLHKLTADDAEGGDWFGSSVCVSGDIIVVGACGDNVATGCAYVFDSTTGEQLHALLANDGAVEDWFGASVFVSGNIIVIGADSDDDAGAYSGAAYVFDATTGEQLHKLTAVDASLGDFFGVSVSLSANTIAVGATGDDQAGENAGAAYVFDATTGEQLHKLTAVDGEEDDWFGASVSVSGSTVVVGAHCDDHEVTDAGAAYVFDATTGEQLYKLTAHDPELEDYFGLSVAIHGDTVVVGALYDDAAWPEDPVCDSGAAYVFDASTGQQIKKLTANDGACGDYFGLSVFVRGEFMAIGAPWGDVEEYEPGAAYIFSTSNSCPADFDGNGVVNTADLLHLLGCWATGCGDVNGDGTTNTADLLELLGAWGECP